MPEIVKIKILDIIVGDRKRKSFENIEELAAQINEVGLLQPIIVDSDKKLIAGERRIRAHQLLGLDEIDARIFSEDQISDREYMEYIENNGREDFTVSEKVDIAIAIEAKVKKAGDRRGKKTKVIDSETDVNVADSPRVGKTRDFVASRAGFKSTYAYRSAREVIEKAIPEVVEAMDRTEISIAGAKHIVQQPKKKQLTTLNEARQRLDSDGTELNNSQTERRAAKRKDKLGIPKKRLRHLNHNIIRIAPNWDDTVFTDILETPVNDFASPRIAIVVLECMARHIPLAIQCLDHWDFEYCTTVTVFDPKANVSHLELTTADTAHLIIGMRRGEGEVGEIIRLESLEKTPPVVARYSNPLIDSCIHIIEGMYPAAKADRRIDMTSTTPRRGWIVWKLTYGDDAVIDDGIDLQPEVDADIDNSESEAIPGTEAVDLFDTDELPETTDTITDTDNTFEPPKRKLKLFG